MVSNSVVEKLASVTVTTNCTVMLPHLLSPCKSRLWPYKKEGVGGQTSQYDSRRLDAFVVSCMQLALHKLVIRKEGLPISLARCRSSLYLFQKSEDLPIFESFTMTDGPNLRKLASSLPLSASFFSVIKIRQISCWSSQIDVDKCCFLLLKPRPIAIGVPCNRYTFLSLI